MECPVCSLPLVVVERKGIELDWCVNCRGFWFDRDELALIPEALGCGAKAPDPSSLPPVSSHEKARRCPRCRRQMEKVDLGDGLATVVDRCPAGEGLWFDAGEIGRAFSSGGKPGGASGGMVSFLGEAFSMETKKPEGGVA
jgi:Zn-finger nucleic acid-binding protein